MKRTMIAMLALGITLSACAGGVDVGGGLDDVDTKIEKSKSPTPKTSKSKPPKADKPKESKPPEVKGDTIIVAVRDNNQGFEWRHPDLGWLDVHTWGGPSVFVGDIIVFKNLDPQTHIKHGFRNETSGGAKAGELFDTGQLSKGDQVRIKVTFKPGEYLYSDPGVPYRDKQGPLCVFDRDKIEAVGENCEPAGG